MPATDSQSAEVDGVADANRPPTTAGAIVVIFIVLVAGFFAARRKKALTTEFRYAWHSEPRVNRPDTRLHLRLKGI
ncbi:MAG: hypothetical protein ABIP49_05005 [Lysobacterales bacterium]